MSNFRFTASSRYFISHINIEALCAAPPEAFAHSPSQMPLSGPVAPPSQCELHKDRAVVVVAWRGGRAQPCAAQDVTQDLAEDVLGAAEDGSLEVLILPSSGAKKTCAFKNGGLPSERPPQRGLSGLGLGPP